jgi:E3 ubiquitin-protein ligase HUWE1
MVRCLLNQLTVERGHEGHVNAILYISFQKRGGMTALLTSVERIMTQVISDAADEQDSRLPLFLLSALSSPRALVENAQMHAVQRDNTDISPLKDFIALRLAILPLVTQIWNSDWILKAPISLVKMIGKTLLMIMDAKSEKDGETAISGQIGVPAPARAPAVADPARIDQLVDMGFARDAAEYALLRVRNNVAAAADLILSMPHLFLNDAPPPPVAPTNTAALGTSQTSANDESSGNTTDAPLTLQPESAASDEAGDEASRAMDTAQDNVNDAVVEADSLPSPKDRLDVLRSETRPNLPQRALLLIERAEELVFDLLSAFPATEEGVSQLFDSTAKLVELYTPTIDAAIAARLRLLTVFLRSHSQLAPGETNIVCGVKIISTLPLDAEAKRPWLTAALLLGESLLILSANVTDTKLGDDPLDLVQDSPITDNLAALLVPVCISILADLTSTKETLLSVMRLLVVITRKAHADVSAQAALAAFKASPAKLAGCHPLLAITLRHAFEDRETLSTAMRYEIKEWLSPARNNVTDVNHFIRQLRQVAVRDPPAFVQSVEQECTLVEPSPPQSVYHIRGRKDTTTSKPPSDPFQDTGARHGIMDHLVDELDKTFQELQSIDASSETQEYASLLMASITELVGSYLSAKNAFMLSIRRPGTFSKTKSGLSAMMSDMLGHVHLGQDLDASKTSHRKMQCTRVMAMIVALCTDTVSDLKEVSEDVVAIRRAVLDVIIKTVKDTSIIDPNLRCGRLWAMGELIQRLLVSKTTAAPSRNETPSLHMAKAMLEKNYVGLMTTALSELDLGFPGIRVVLLSLLRAMDHL